LSLLSPFWRPRRCCRHASRAASGRTVSVNQYNNNDWIAAFKQAFNDGDTVVVPAGLTCENINTGIFIPDGKTLLIRGALTGNGRGRFVLQEGSKVIGEGAAARRTLRSTFAALTASKGWP
jgi:hypothetical protein